MSPFAKNLNAPGTSESTAMDHVPHTHEDNLTVFGVFKSLFPQGEPIDLLKWPPNLFAFTSSVLSLSGAYHAVVSPPRTPPPTKEFMDKVKVPLVGLQAWPPESAYMAPAIAEACARDFNGLSQIPINYRKTTDIKLQYWAKQARKDYKRLKARIENRLDATPMGNLKTSKSGPVRWSDLVQESAKSWFSEIEECCSNQECDDVLSIIKDMESRTCKVLGNCKMLTSAWVVLWAFAEEILASDRGILDFLDIDDESELLNSNRDTEASTNPNNDEKIKSALGLYALITLHAIADEVCARWGIRNSLRGTDNAPGEAEILPVAIKSWLQEHGSLATFSPTRGRVLPKRHNPSVGIALRSISNSVGFHKSSIDVVWRDSPDNTMVEKVNNIRSFSVLLLPWPLEISATNFKQVLWEDLEIPPLRTNDRHGYFDYRPYRRKHQAAALGDFCKELDLVIKSARSETDSIDFVVLPECAIEKEWRKDIEAILQDNGVSGYIAGFVEGSQEDAMRRFARNGVFVRFGRKSGESISFDTDQVEIEKHLQHKHHRWKLSRAQVETYGLGIPLSPTTEWWESMKILRRRVSFFNVGERITMCALICEDLARQDPIADLLRTAGPSLVVSILLDGPQLLNRWPARYASVLAEDPGTSVLTLTSYGMVRRWKPPYGTAADRQVVALWHDSFSRPRELALDPDAKGILLSLSPVESPEFTADGRKERFPTTTLTLSGIHQVKVP